MASTAKKWTSKPYSYTPLCQITVYLENSRLWDQIWPKERMIKIVRNRHWIHIQHNTSNSCAKFHLIFRIINFRSKFSQKLLYGGTLTLFRMGFFGTAHGWEGEGGKKAHPPLGRLSVTLILQWNLAQSYLTQRRSKKYMNHMTHHLSSADMSIFSPEISKFCYIKKYRYKLYFDT